MNTGKGWNMSEPRSINSEIREKRYEDGFRVMQGKREYVTYPDDSSLRIWYSDVPWRYENHEHSAVEICLTLAQGRNPDPLTGYSTLPEYGGREQPVPVPV